MDTHAQLTAVPPQPMTATPSSSLYHPPDQRRPWTPSQSHPQLGLQMGPESQIPDHPGSVVDVAGPQQQQHSTMSPPPQAMSSAAAVDIRSARTSCTFEVAEYVSLRKKKQRQDASTSTVDLESRVRAQAHRAVGDLRALHQEVRRLARAAESHRWRKWLVGGLMAGFIPLIRRFFRRGSDEESASVSNDTEYAFRRSKGLLSRIKQGVFGKGSLASLAFLVFAVLYVFSNEVSLRVARTVQKRIRKLCGKIERGDAEIGDDDLKALEGWRWRTPKSKSASFSWPGFSNASSTLPYRCWSPLNPIASAIFSPTQPQLREIIAPIIPRLRRGALQDEDLDDPLLFTATKAMKRKLDDDEAAEARERHYRDLHSKPPDFKELARLDPDFAAVVKGRELDFDDPASVMQLTKTLLKVDFGLHIELPNDRLCPPVANRHNYIRWLKDLLDSSSYDLPGGQKVGLDIGTGASCIYPLLGCVQLPWSFIATDIDEKNFEFATKNVKLNDLQSRIQVVKRQPDDCLLPLDELNKETVDFTMTNPPFYKSEEELTQSAAQKSRAPFTACTGACVEMVTEGGEVGFFERILAESLVLRQRVQWYTTMLGFLSSVTKAVELLLENGIDNYAVTEFIQGSKTRRWAVAWSFGAMRPASAVARGIRSSGLPKNICPLVTESDGTRLALPESIGTFSDTLSGAIASLDLVSWTWDKERLEGVGRAVDKVWARAWRRRKMREQEEKSKTATVKDGTEREVKFGFKVFVRIMKEELVVGCRWMEGHDPIVFESFRGYLKATAKASVPS